jgi:hypothetical protein
MISPRAVIRDRHIHVPRVPAWRSPGLSRAWRRLSPRHLLWLALWAPWWVGNELPPPPLPHSGEADMADPPAGTPGAWLLDTLDDLKFRFGLAWTAALLLRGAWLGGLVGIGWLLLGLTGAVASPEPRQLAWLAGAGAALGLVLRVFHRPRYAQVALLLERAFDLRSRLSTAVAGLRYDAADAGGLHMLQLADAANALDRARSQLRPVHWVPIREIFLGFIVALAMLLLLVAQRPEGEIGAVSRAGVPPFVPVSERLAASREQAVPPEMPDPATLEQVEDISRTSNQAREDLETIAGALQTNPNTAPAGDAITNEDYSGANRQLDASAEDVTQLPAEDREQLADQLDEAGDQVSEQNPELADSAHRAADDVRSGEDTGGLGDLGDEIEQTGEDVIPQQSEGGELSDAPADEQGAPQAGAPGGGEAAQAEQPQSGEQGSGQTQASSQGDPGSGMSASAGTGETQDGSSTSQGAGGEGEQQSPSGSGEQGQPGESQADGAGEGQQGEASGENQAGGSTSGSPNEEGDSSQGAGAGGGERDANDPTQEGGSGGGGGDLDNEEQAPESGQGEAGDPPPGGDGQDGEEQTGTAGGGSSIQLPGTSDERVRSGSDIGASSVGTGGGVGAGSGDSSGSASGSTGPDPNTVPARWRTVVEDYFREGGAP